MLTSGVHTDINVPPAASMFGRESKKGQKASSDLSAAVVDMVSVYFEPSLIYKCTDTDEPSASFKFSPFSCNVVSIETS